jgi:hypothetical protein
MRHNRRWDDKFFDTDALAKPRTDIHPFDNLHGDGL